jgi:hypothetical protein
MAVHVLTTMPGACLTPRTTHYASYTTMNRIQALKGFDSLRCVVLVPHSRKSAERSDRDPRTVHRFEYSSSLLKAVDGTHPDPEKRWNTLNESKQDELWLDEFRMHKETFRELFQLCEPQIPQHRAVNPAYRVYRKRHKLLMTLSWLAHVHTSRQLRNRFNVPQYIHRKDPAAHNRCLAQGASTGEADTDNKMAIITCKVASRSRWLPKQIWLARLRGRN